MLFRLIGLHAESANGDALIAISITMTLVNRFKPRLFARKKRKRIESAMKNCKTVEHALEDHQSLGN
jgi:hypothetical protein